MYAGQQAVFHQTAGDSAADYDEVRVEEMDGVGQPHHKPLYRLFHDLPAQGIALSGPGENPFRGYFVLAGQD